MPAAAVTESRLSVAAAVASIVMVILLLWYFAAVALNATWTRDQAARAGQTLNAADILADTMTQKRPKLPAPHQVASEVLKSTFLQNPGSKRSLIYHAGITLQAAFLGFLIGAAAGAILAIAIVHDRAVDMSVMPWAVASQAVPILALAPMVIVVMNSIGITGLIPKALISAYLSFFPVLVGVVVGFRSPDPIQIDLLKTYNASRWQIFCKLRLPISTPHAFASLKIASAAAIVGAIVGELPTGAVAGLGARLLTASYYGQTVQIWSALFAAAVLAASVVGALGLIQSVCLRRMGMAR